MHLLTVDEYLEIEEVEPGYTELVEGRLLMSPSPVPDHSYAAGELKARLRAQLPDGIEALEHLDVDLQLAPPDAPGTVRRPDLIVVPRDARLRVRREGGVIHASEVLVVVEVLFLGSKRTDHVLKRSESVFEIGRRACVTAPNWLINCVWWHDASSAIRPTPATSSGS
jgi:Uma2 family endonuclease